MVFTNLCLDTLISNDCSEPVKNKSFSSLTRDKIEFKKELEISLSEYFQNKRKFKLGLVYSLQNRIIKFVEKNQK